jgi:hypothetical protein
MIRGLIGAGHREVSQAGRPVVSDGPQPTNEAIIDTGTPCGRNLMIFRRVPLNLSG